MKPFKLFSLVLLLQNLLFSQSLEPRLYANAPTDLNFLVIGYVKSLGGLELNTQLDLQDAKLDVDVGVLAFARGFDFFGKSAKVDVSLPYMFLGGSAFYNGEKVTRSENGIGDIKARVSVNLYGAPALKLKDFSSYTQDFIVGASLQFTFPSGAYDKAKLINVGRNMYAAKLGLGSSKRFDNLIVELAVDAEFYSKNSEYYRRSIYEQKPVYSVQTHLIYTFNRALWMGLDANYFMGGETKLNGVLQDNGLANSRFGGVLALALSKSNSIKISASSGISTRVGTDFTTAGVFYQYRWGGGL